MKYKIGDYMNFKRAIHLFLIISLFSFIYSERDKQKIFEPFDIQMTFDDEFNNKYKLEIATKEIEINLFLLSFSFKKRYPKKTLIIGKIK